MREQLNNNPLAQLAVLAVLLLAAGVFVISSTGGGGEEEAGEGATSSSSLTIDPSGTSAPVEASGAPVVPAGATPPLPKPVLRAWESGETVVLLFVRDGGIDDGLVAGTTGNLTAFPDAAKFVIPAKQISRYGSITEGLGIERVPALVVISPRRLGEQVPTASVQYGFRSQASVGQAVIDAGYEGRTLQYHP